MLIRKLLLYMLVCVFLAPVSSSAYSFDKYDRQIQRSMHRWMPGTDWQLLWGLIRQESAFREQAVSPVGAAGLTQFMPATWKEVSTQLGLPHASPHQAGPSIEAGAFYLGRLRSNWHSPRPERDRLMLALASYNAGLGNLLNAQRRCGMAVLYHEIIACLPEVTGHHSTETLHYVPAVWRYYTKKRMGIL